MSGHETTRCNGADCEVCRCAEADELREKILRERGWRPMSEAPHDGTEIVLLLHHHNRRYARTEAERAQWTAEVRARWIDHNGGGFTWRGMAGYQVAWKPVVTALAGSPSEIERD